MPQILDRVENTISLEANASNVEFQILPEGSILATYRAYLSDSQSFELQIQVFASDGSLVSGPITLGTQNAEESFERPTNFHVGPVSNEGILPVVTIFGTFGREAQFQLFDLSGQPMSEPVKFITENTTYRHQSFVLEILDDGSYAVAWDNFNSTTLGAITLQMVSDEGIFLGDAQVLVETDGDDFRFGPDVASLSGGGFVVSWGHGKNRPGDETTGAFFQLFTKDGTAISDPLRFDDTFSYLEREALPLSEGGFALFGLNFVESGKYQLVARVFDAQGAPLSNVFLIAEPVSNPQSIVAVELTGGEILFAWSDPSGSVFAQRFDLNGFPLSSVAELVEGSAQSNGKYQIETIADGNLLLVSEGSDSLIFNPQPAAPLAGLLVQKEEFFFPISPIEDISAASILQFQNTVYTASNDEMIRLFQTGLFLSSLTASGLDKLDLNQRIEDLAFLIGKELVGNSLQQLDTLGSALINFKASSLGSVVDSVSGSDPESLLGPLSGQIAGVFDLSGTLLAASGNAIGASFGLQAFYTLVEIREDLHSLQSALMNSTAVHQDVIERVAEGLAKSDLLLEAAQVSIPGASFDDLMLGWRESFMNLLDPSGSASVASSVLRWSDQVKELSDTFGLVFRYLRDGNNGLQAALLEETVTLAPFSPIMSHYIAGHLHTASTFRDGTEGQNVILGGAGTDLIRGFEGNDHLFGLPGGDLIQGGPGDDILDGGEGPDVLNGDSGADILIPGFGDDIIDGGSGADRIVYYNIASLIGDTIVELEESDTVDLLFSGADSLAFEYGPSAIFVESNSLSGELSIQSIAGLTLNRSTIDGGVRFGVQQQIVLPPGDNIWTSGVGNQFANGGPGTDIAKFSGIQSNYTLTYRPQAEEFIVSDRRSEGDGTDTLIGFELLDFELGSVFDDGSGVNTYFDLRQFADFALLQADDFVTFVEMYIAYFNRAPDAIGLFFWGSVLAQGKLTLEQIADDFFNQAETQAAYPDLNDNTNFAQQVYENVLGRSFDPAGLEFWVGVLESGARTKSQFILEILKGVDAAPSPDATAEFLEQRAQDQQYLTDKTDLGIYSSVILGMSDATNAFENMSEFNGSEASLAAAKNAIDLDYVDALSPEDGEFLMQLVGVIDDPFSS